MVRVSVFDADGDSEKEEEVVGEFDVDFGGGSILLFLEGGEGVFVLRFGGFLGVFFFCVEGSLDRESRDLYGLRLVVTDAGFSSLSMEEMLLFRVADFND